MQSRRSLLIGAILAVIAALVAAGLVVIRVRRDEKVLGARAVRVVGGLMERSGKVEGGRPYVDSVVAPVDWADLEASDQVFAGPGWSLINGLVTDPRGFKLRLRVYAGRYSPAWAKRLGGPTVSGGGIDCSAGGIAVTLANNPHGGCVPYFWSDEFLAQYEELVREIARRYEGVPAVLEMQAAGCMTIFAEPFIRAGGDLGSNTRLFRAGLNETTDQRCHERMIQIHMNTFSRIRTSYSTHTSWQLVSDPAIESDGLKSSWSLERQLIDTFRSRYADRLIMMNNGLGETNSCKAGTPETNMWCWFRSIPQPKGFQTETWKKLGSSSEGIYATLDNALSMGACFIELPRGVIDSENRFPDYDARLEANCQAPASPSGAFASALPVASPIASTPALLPTTTSDPARAASPSPTVSRTPGPTATSPKASPSPTNTCFLGIFC